MKFKKIVSIGLLSVSLGGFIVPSVSTSIVHAQSSVSDSSKIRSFVETYKYKYISQLSKENADKYKNALILGLKSKNLNEESANKVVESIDKLAAKENNILIIESRANFWDGQGITVDEFGATIDTALILLSGGGAAGAKAAINGLIAKFGQQVAVDMIVNKLVQLGLGAFVSQLRRALPWIIGLTSPGKGIANFIDSIDFYKNNGRINFWP